MKLLVVPMAALADSMYHQNALNVGENLLKLGGVSKVIDILERQFGQPTTEVCVCTRTLHT